MSLDCSAESITSWDVPRPRPAYSGSFRVGAVSISVTFMIDDDEDGVLWMYLTSPTLGYELDGGYDTRLRLPMAGDYGDNDTKQTNCKELGLSFEVDLAGVVAGYTTGCIAINPADMAVIEREHVCGPMADPVECICERACISYTELDEDGEALYSVQYKTCYEVINGVRVWKAEFEDPEITVPISIETPTVGDTLRFVLAGFSIPNGSFTPDEPTQDVCCPPDSEDVAAQTEEATGCLMRATWSGAITYDYGYDYSYDAARSIEVSIRGEPRYRCSDCKCFCRCLCVTQYDLATGGIHRGVICLDDYDINTWSGEIPAKIWNDVTEEWDDDNSDTKSIRISVDCDPCTGITSLACDGELSPQEDFCPDVSADFSFGDPETGYSIYATCAVCPESCPPLGRFVHCCSEIPVPTVLFATFSPVAPCPGGGFVVDMPWQEVFDNSRAPLYYTIGTGATARHFAFISDWFTMPGAGTKQHRIFAAPCSGTCPDPTKPVPWEAEMVSEDWPDISHDCDGTLGVTCMADCSAILLTGAFIPCGCIAADYGGWDVVISE